MTKQEKLHKILSKFLEEGVRSNVWEIMIRDCIKDIEQVYKKGEEQ